MTFESGTKTLLTDRGSIELGTRMLYQLRKGENWEAFISKVDNQRTPGEVLEALAQG